MTKTTFVSGTVVPPAWFNSIQAIAFDDQLIDGHYSRLTNDALANTAGNIRYDFYAQQDALKVTAATGLIVNYNAGSVTLQDGSVVTIAAGQISLPANATSYVFVNTSGVVATSTVYPVRSLMMASAVTNSTQVVGSISDLRPNYAVRPIAQSLRVFGGLGGQGDYTLNSGSDTLSGEYWFNNFTLAAGASITIAGAAYIYCTGNVNIQGTIAVTPPVKGGQGYTGSLIAQHYPNSPGSGVGGGNSVNSASSATYSYLVSPLGSGGGGGWVSLLAPASIVTPRGGNGGGAIVFESAGTISCTGTITANGEAGQGNGSVVGYLGASLSGFSGSISGGGGGSGGLIWLKSLRTIAGSAATVLSVVGGAGGTGYPDAVGQKSGGGGGGGYVVCSAPAVNLTGATINLTGGTSASNANGFGSVAGGSFAGAGGTAGAAGSIGQLVVRTVIPA